MAKSLVDTHMSKIPPRPEQGKWTKTQPAVDWIVNLDVRDSVLPNVVDDAHRNIEIKTEAIEDGANIQTKGLSLHEVSGIRLAGARIYGLIINLML